MEPEEFVAEDVSASNKESRPQPRKPAVKEEASKTHAQAHREELKKKYPNGLGYQLAPYDSNNETERHLDLAHMVGGDVKPQKANFFLCATCNLVVC